MQIGISAVSSVVNSVSAARACRMHDDALDPLNQFQHSVLAVLDRLRGLAPAAIEDGIGGRDAGRRRCILAAHDADEHPEGRSGVAARERAEKVRALVVFPRTGKRAGACSSSPSISSLTKKSPTARLQPGPRARAISGRRSSSLHNKRNARQIAQRGAIVSGANPISVNPGDRSGAGNRPSAAGRHVRACTASNGSDDGAPIGAPGLSSAWPQCVAAVRFRSRTKKPAADALRAGQSNSSR